MRNRTVTARETASNVPGLRRISVHTVRNRLRENVLRARRPSFGAVPRRWHRFTRVRWCNRVREWDLKAGGESVSAMNQDSCCRRDGRTRV